MSTLRCSMRRQYPVMGLATLFCFSSNLLAAELSGAFDVGAGYSDNVLHSDNAPLSSSVVLAGFDFALTESTNRIESDVRARFSHLWYLDDLVDSENVFGFDGFARFSLIEDRLSWILRDNYGQELRDPFGSTNPANRENVNYFTTGPTLTVPLGSRNQFGLEALYSDVMYETRPLDSNRYQASTWFGRDIKENLFISLNGQVTNVRYDSPGQINFDRTDVFLRINSESARNLLNIDLGVTSLSRPPSQPDDFNPLLTVEITRQLSPKSTLSISGGTRYMDPAEVFRLGQQNSESVDQTQDVENDGVPFRYDNLRLAYGFDGERTRLTLSGTLGREDYWDLSDRSRYIAIAETIVERDASRKVFYNGIFRVARRDYIDLPRIDTDVLASLTAGYRLGSASSVSFEYSYLRRYAEGNDSDFNEHRVFLRFSYVPSWSRRAL